MAPNQLIGDRDEPSLAQYTPNYDLRPPGFTAPQEVFSSTPLKSFAASNQQLVASLARQSLPKCHPEVFKGDDQELNDLRSFTSGDPQELVDNYRNRQGSNPANTLNDLWAELERRFGNAAALTQALIERVCTAASFSDKDNVNLQKLADLCADVDCQMKHLPGLACLNCPIAIRPRVERFPAYLRSKWEKEIVRYATEYNDAHPTFSKFSAMIQSQARKRNRPNVFAGVTTPISTTVNRQREESKRRPSPEPGLEAGRMFKTDTTLDSGALPEKEATKPPRVKYCIYHDRAGHKITECKAFTNLNVEEKEDWIFEERLCFRCFSPDHVASACKERVKCSISGSERHADLLHLGREERKERVTKESEQTKENAENVTLKCTSICKGSLGGLSCSKIVLVDVYSEDNPHEVHRVYASVDDQSNASLITTDLSDKLSLNLNS